MIEKTNLNFRETLMKVFPALDLRHKAANSAANPFASAGGSKKERIYSVLSCTEKPIGAIKKESLFTGPEAQIHGIAWH